MMRRIFTLCLFVAAIPPGATVAFAQETAPGRIVILDRDLHRIAGSLESFSANTLQYTDSTGRSRSIERARVLALFGTRLHSASVPSALSAGDGSGGVPGILRLTDGQVVPGFLIASDSPGESLSWRSRRIGQFVVPLERASSLALSDAVHEEQSPQRDTAVLANGDRLEGFVVSIGKQLVIEVGGKNNAIPIDRATQIELANPVEPGALPLVFLSDGSALAATDLASASSPGKPSAPSATATAQWALASDGGTGLVDIESIDSILFEPRAVVPLASIPIEHSVGLEGRRWTPTPFISPVNSAPLGLASITISGPAQVDWILPDGSQKFGASIMLPPGAAPWGNAAVSILVADASGSFREVAKAELSADKPAADIVANVTDGSVLRLEVRSRAYSDVQSRVTLGEPLVLRKPNSTRR
ncbi:MAG: hypothetical protein KF691_12900 [Phycisphaeraceae bacterium]|nr:hypothetical protein [Phycisphaeraceae bacterium]